jgi:hypothetical protein
MEFRHGVTALVLKSHIIDFIIMYLVMYTMIATTDHFLSEFK